MNCDECNSRQEWLNVGKQLLKDEETVICEYYLLGIDGNLREVDKKSFDKRKLEYEEEKNRVQYKANLQIR